MERNVPWFGHRGVINHVEDITAMLLKHPMGTTNKEGLHFPTFYPQKMENSIYGDVCMASEMLPAAVVAKYLTSTSSSCCNFSRLGRIRFWMSSSPIGEGLAGWPDFSRERIVPSAGRRFRTSMRIVYDFATLKRMLGMSSDTNLSIIGRIESLITSRLMAGAKV